MTELGFYYPPCPLCGQDVHESKPDDYHLLLPLNSARASDTVRWKPRWVPESQCVLMGDFVFTRQQTYPSLDYNKRSFLLHNRCHELVKELSDSQLHLLIDLVEPTFLSRSPPANAYSAFSSPCPASSLSMEVNLRQFLFQVPERLPREIWNMVLEYDIGRFLFVMETASQITAWRPGGLENTPSQRFTQETLIVEGDMIRIYLINIGGRTYVRHLSNPTGPENRNRSQDYNLNGSNYLAVKSDGIGVIDIAFKATKAGPEWILSNPPCPFQVETSMIRCADVRGLRIFRDSLKCRAITLSREIRAEPYFYTLPSPPKDSWVVSGFSVASELSENRDPFAYFTRAIYIPFADIKNISFDIDPGRLGIEKIITNVPKPDGENSVSFSQPPKTLKFLLCGVPVVHQYMFQYPFLQFEVNGQWRPPLPRGCTILRHPTLIHDVMGIWWGETFPFVPIHIGVVVNGSTE